MKNEPAELIRRRYQQANAAWILLTLLISVAALLLPANDVVVSGIPFWIIISAAFVTGVTAFILTDRAAKTGR